MKGVLYSTIFLSILCISNCKDKEDKPNVPKDYSNFTIGKNNFIINLEGANREYIVEIPPSYTGKEAVPVVIMCHGGGQDGELMYKISGWKDFGDSNNIITVYPSALVYCVVDDGITSNSSKWNCYPGGSSFCAGVKPKNDINFMKEMINQLREKYNVDSKRIYMVGFSNGGQLAGTCSIEMSDILAATISCGGGGSLPEDTTLYPKRLLPVMLMFGNKDERLVKSVGLSTGNSVPMGFEQLYTKYPFLYVLQAKPYIDNFKLNTTPVFSGDTNSVFIADYTGLSGNSNNVFKMVEVKGLGHEYPNGLNYPLKGAPYHWAWLKKYTLP